jgi:hypothetical protein
MLNKKLLTLACAVGILVCGACGMFDRPLPPPMTLFVGIHTVRVVVTNKSATHQIDADGVQQAIIKELNMPSNQTHMRAVPDGDADCTLSLDILDEDARKSIQDPQRDGALWSFRALFSTKLTGKDGKPLWAKTKWPYESNFGFYRLHGRDITNAWTEPAFRKEFNESLASQLVEELLSK